MNAVVNRPSRVLQIAAALFPLVAFAATARADIFEWEYINPADPSQGKQQSTTLAPDGAGVDAVPGVNLSSRNLTMAYLIGADLTGAAGYYTNLTNADLSQANLANSNLYSAILTGTDLSQANLPNADFVSANLTGANFPEAILTNARFGLADLTGANFRKANLANADFTGEPSHLCEAEVCPPLHATLTDSDFTDADVRGAKLGYTEITLAQLYATASYQDKDLSGIRLDANNLAGGNFAGQNLTNASFVGATLTGADLTDANVRGASFATDHYYGGGTGITLSQLYSTASYRSQDLSGIDLTHGSFFADENFAGGNFAGQKLTNASFSGATLTNADFTDADVRGANFSKKHVCWFSCYPGIIIGTGITPAQLYTTASYQAHDLSGIGLRYNNLTGGNFARQNLSHADFLGANLTGANFREANLTNANLGATLTGADITAADARGAYHYQSDVIATNLIRPDGHIGGLNLDAGGLLVVRDYDGSPYTYDPNHDSRDPIPRPPIPLTVDQYFAMGPGGTLRMVFEADDWNSTISFAPGIPVTLGGTLELTFTDDVNLASQVGRTLDLIDWTGVNPTGAFAISSPYSWDVLNLYTTGEVTLTAIPEPTTLVLLMFAAACWCLRRARAA